MIITYWKGVFVVDKADTPAERIALKKAGFELHEPSVCPMNKRCRACRANIGSRYWSNRVESATRLAQYCNQRAKDAMADHLKKLQSSRAVDSNIIVPTPPGLSLKPYQKAGVAYMVAHKDTYLGDDMGLGKAAPLDAKILTPTGWTTMGEVKKGQLVVGSDGHSYPIEGVYPQGQRKVFRVTFQDGATTECDEEHLWEVNTPLRHHRGYQPKVLTTRQIMDIGLKDKNNRQHFVRLIKPRDYSKKPLTIDPYVMGYLLGNGCLSQRSVVVIIPDQETVDRLSSLLPKEIILSQQRKIDSISYIVKTPQRSKHNPFLNQIRQLNLMGCHSYNKMIPSEYFWTTTQNRIALLQGLIDSDGHVRPKDGNIEYSSSSHQLAKDVQQLVWSLGGIAKIRPKKTKRRMSYRMSVVLPNNITPCRLTRKLINHRARTKYPPTRSMVKIEYVGLKETQCIAVASPDHLYVTDDFILTHNTIQTLGFINYLRPTTPDLNTLIVAPTTLSYNWREEIERWIVPVNGKLPEIIIVPSNSFEIPKRNNLIVITNYEKLTGDTLLGDSLKRVWDVLVCDEAQALKNWHAQRTQAVLGPEGLMQRAHRSVFLSGTPIENYPKEIWSIAASICPAKFGDWFEYAGRYCGLHRENHGGRSRLVDTGATHLAELQQRLRTTCLAGDSMIETEHGPIPIRNIVSRRLPIRVWSCDSLGSLSLQPVVGFSRKAHNNILVKIHHAKGSLTCTPDHGILALEGEKRADACSVGDHLLILQKAQSPKTGHAKNHRQLRNLMLHELHGENKAAASESPTQNHQILPTQDHCSHLPAMRKKVRRQEHPHIPGSKILPALLPGKASIQNLWTPSHAIGARPLKKKHHCQRVETPESSQSPYRTEACSNHLCKNVNLTPKTMVGDQTKWPRTPSTTAPTASSQPLTTQRTRTLGPAASPRPRRREFRSHDPIPNTGKQGDLCRHIHSSVQNDNRSGRTRPRNQAQTTTRQGQGPSLGNTRILDIEILEMGRGRKAKGSRKSDQSVYDIEVAKNHNFFANDILVHNCMIRRLKSDVLKELPPKRRQLIVLGDSKVDWSADPDFKRWKDLYEKDYEAKLAHLEAAKTQEEYANAARHLELFTGVAFKDMSKLRHKTAMAKLPACIEYIDNALKAGLEKVVIFAHHQDVLKELARHYGDEAVSLDGETPQKDRGPIVKKFQEGNTRIFIGGLKAAGVGLNLFAASTAIFIELDWNPAKLSQAEDRLCRIGQEKMVHVIHLVLDGTLDVNICKRVLSKMAVVDKALNQHPDIGIKQSPQVEMELA